MSSSPFLPLPTSLEIVSVETAEHLLKVQVASTKERAFCPLCHSPTFRRHSQYTRMVADLPCAGLRVQLVLHVRKFFCDTVGCTRKIFTERLPAFVEPWARVTVRLRQALEAVGIATCGEVGTRLGERLALPTSPTTLLRRVMALPTDAVGLVNQLGIDDFALRRGRNYGTVLVDLVRHRVIDLLPDRRAETAKGWMLAHPEIDLVTRDRGEDYASAAKEGAPQAVQSADRFHLVKNLTEAVQKALVHCRAELQKELKGTEPADPLAAEEPLDSLVTSDGQPYSAHQTERYERYQQVVRYRSQGMKTKEIAKRVGLGIRTLQRWLQSGEYVETNYHHRHRSRFDKYEAYVKQRWDEGCHNIQQLWREIKAQGYPHSDQALRRHIETLSGKEKADFPEASEPFDHFSAKKAMWLFIRRSANLDEKEREELATIRQASETAETLYQLIQQFLQMVRQLEGEHLDAWLTAVAESGIEELQRFANGLQQDKAAVLMGLTHSSNNAQAEGQVTRIKLIKRMMYGRAGFPLLRQRVLHRF
jgi:transposase